MNRQWHSTVHFAPTAVDVDTATRLYRRHAHTYAHYRAVHATGCIYSSQSDSTAVHGALTDSDIVPRYIAAVHHTTHHQPVNTNKILLSILCIPRYLCPAQVHVLSFRPRPACTRFSRTHNCTVYPPIIEIYRVPLSTSVTADTCLSNATGPYRYSICRFRPVH